MKQHLEILAHILGERAANGLAIKYKSLTDED